MATLRPTKRAGAKAAGPVVGLAGTALYAYLLNSINLPETLWLLVLAGALLGAAIGRWWIVSAALVTWSFPMLDSLRDDEVASLVFYVYMPLAAVSIASGVATRKLATRAVAELPRGRHPRSHRP